MRGRPTILSFLALMVSILPAALGEAPKADPLRARIEKMGKDFADAYNRGDDKAVAAFYGPDAALMPPDSDVVTGAPAIEAFWKSGHAMGMKGVKLETDDVVSSGNYLVETGRAIVDMAPAGQPASTQTFKYVVVWRKQKDGSWKIYRDIWNGMAAAAAPHH